MFPYIVVSRHHKYSSCLPLDLKDMKDLPLYQEEVYDEFMCGNFSVHQVQDTINGVLTDLVLEQTYNKEGKTTLPKGISKAPAACEKLSLHQF